MELTIDLANGAASSGGQDNCNEALLNDLITQISDLSEICAGFEDSAEIMTKTIAAIRRAYTIYIA